MFPLEFDVNIRRGNGRTQRFKLVENQGDEILVVLPPEKVREACAHFEQGGALDDALVEVFAEALVVIDREKGKALTKKQTLAALLNSRIPAVRQAGLRRQPLAEEAPTAKLSPEDLAWTFAQELARRERLTAS